MKKVRPSKFCGRFLSLDGFKHEWFFPLFKTFFHSVKVYFFKQELKKDFQKKLVEKPLFFELSEDPQITWLGHSTFLIQVGGKNILTDPIFGPLSFVFRRIVPSVITVTDLPKIDYVLISHNHFDHMDSKSLHQIKKHSPDVKILVPMGDKAWFDKHKFKKVSEHTWWENIVESDITFTFLPANHWSQRTLFDKNRSLWGSWMIQHHDFKVYFAGDTSWGDHFDQIGKEFGHIDIACMPIAPGEPRSWMKHSHINAKEAVKAFIKLKAKMFLPMHWGTYHLGFDDFYTPIKLLKKTWQELKYELQHKELNIVKFGQIVKGARQGIFSTIKQKEDTASL